MKPMLHKVAQRKYLVKLPDKRKLEVVDHIAYPSHQYAARVEKVIVDKITFEEANALIKLLGKTVKVIK